MRSSGYKEFGEALWEDLQTTPACSIIVRPSSIHCFTCCCCPSTMRCTGPLRSPRSNPVSSEAWWTSDRNEVKMGLGTARAPKGADAARTMEAEMRIAGWDGMGPRCAPTKNKTRLTSSHIQRLQGRHVLGAIPSKNSVLEPPTSQ